MDSWSEDQTPYGVIIVGAGQGGAQAATALRQFGHEGPITIIGKECEPPYERPPLSKEYLAGQKSFDRLLIRPPHFWEERRISLQLGTEVLSIDPDNRTITCSDGEVTRFGSLIWAAGGEPRQLTCPGHDLERLHTVRTRMDVDRMRGDLSNTSKVVVIGGGYIGLEAAAVLRRLGKEVVIVEALDRTLSRVAGEPLSRFYEAEHRRQGVDVRLGCEVECVEGVAGQVAGVRLQSGEVISADMVVVGIGIIPSVAPLRSAGAEGSNGVNVDDHCRTTLRQVYAIGDCAAHRNVFAGGSRVRLESVQNANDQATTAARAITAKHQAYRATPWFWSNQYDLRLQTVGLSIGYDATVVRGDMSARSFSIVYLRSGHVIAIDCVNAVKDYVQGRKLVEAGVIVPPDALADASIPLKDMMMA